MEKGIFEVKPPVVENRGKNNIKVFILFSLAFWFGWLSKVPVPPQVTFKVYKNPSSILRFKPVCEFSDPNDIIIAQAELCRHGIDVKIDGKCGRDTALGLCELLCRIEKGYEIHSIYERSHYVKEANARGNREERAVGPF